MVDYAACKNCELLKSQCLDLKEGIKVLTQKLDNLMDTVFCSKSDFSCQTVSTSCQSLSTQTDTESLSSESHIQNILSSDSILDASSTSVQNDILMDVFIKTSVPENNLVSMSPRTYALPLVILPFISLPEQPFWTILT